MAPKSLESLSIFLVTVSLTNLALSVLIAPATLPPSTNTDEEILQCWSPLRRLNGCVEEIYYTLVVEGDSTSLSSACCGAFAGLSDSCLPKMFTFGESQLNVAERLKASCTASPAVSPSSESNDELDGEFDDESDDESDDIKSEQAEAEGK